MSKRFTHEDNSTIITFTDNVSAFSGLKKAKFANKGKLNNDISAHVFEFLDSKGIVTQFIEKIDDHSQRVHMVKMIPIEVIVRNTAAGPWMESLGFKHGDILTEAIIEYRYKNHSLKDPLINSTHIHALNMCTREELQLVNELSLKINVLLSEYFSKKAMNLIDIKLEFGFDEKGNLLLADSITPDTMRIWDSESLEPMDKDVFRKDLGKLDQAYQEVYDRLERA